MRMNVVDQHILLMKNIYRVGLFQKITDFRNENSPCYECFFEDLEGEDLSCRESSIFSPLVGVIGSFMASESIKRIIAHEKMNSELVELNLKENNLRKILNFGHTFAHAYEALSLIHISEPTRLLSISDSGVCL